jgi:hypothetical protein
MWGYNFDSEIDNQWVLIIFEIFIIWSKKLKITYRASYEKKAITNQYWLN